MAGSSNSIAGVPLSVVVVLVGQLAAGIWWGATIHTRAEDMDRRIVFLEATGQDRTKALERLAALEARMNGNADLLIKLIDQVARMQGKP